MEDSNVESVETVESSDSVESVDTSVESSMDEVIDSMTLDDLMDLSSEDYPEFGEENHTGMQPLHHWMKHVPEDVRKHISNLRNDYTRKSQELAKMRSEVEEARAAMRQQNDNIIGGSTAKLVENIDTEAEYDLFDPEGMKAEIQRQAKLMLRDMLQPAQEELQAQQRRMELEKFKSENPEMTDPEYRKEIVNMLKTRPELKLEDAFYIVKSKIGSTQLQKERAELAERKSRQKEMARLSGRGTRTRPSGTPQFKNALEAYKWHKSQLGN